MNYEISRISGVHTEGTKAYVIYAIRDNANQKGMVVKNWKKNSPRTSGKFSTLKAYFRYVNDIALRAAQHKSKSSYSFDSLETLYSFDDENEFRRALTTLFHVTASAKVYQEIMEHFGFSANPPLAGETVQKSDDIVTESSEESTPKLSKKFIEDPLWGCW